MRILIRTAGRAARAVAHRPWPSMALAVLVLIAMAIPIIDLRLGQEDVGVLPESTTARQAYDGITEGFGAGTNGPLLIAVKLDPPARNDRKGLDQLNGQVAQQQAEATQQATDQANELIAQGVPPDEAQAQAEAAAPPPSEAQERKTEQQKKFLKSTASDTRLVKLENKIAKTNDVDSVSQAKVSPDGKAAVFSVISVSAPSSFKTQDLVRNLRANVVPEATKGAGLSAYVGGTTAGYIDLADRISEKLVSVIVIVVALSFLLLLLAFRSIVVPLTAGLMNLLSVAASYGVLTAVFEKGSGSR